MHRLLDMLGAIYLTSAAVVIVLAHRLGVLLGFWG
jgi:hypothetical protein